MPFGFGKKTTTPEAPAADAPIPSIGLAKGTITLEKRQVINLAKTKKITVTISWPDKTDYDVFALVQYKDGHVETVAQFGTTRKPHDFTARTKDDAVIHLGDVKKGEGVGKKGLADETIDIILNDNITRIVPVAYSAKSNGTGSFRKYNVGMTIDNGAGDTVIIDARDASDNDHIYSCIPGVIDNGDQVRIQKLELYSHPNSELRPTLDSHGNVLMDTGLENANKQ